MDFIILMGLYLAVCCIFLGCYLTNFIMLQYVPLCYMATFFHRIVRSWENKLPLHFISVSSKLLDHIFIKRNVIFQCLYILIVILSHLVGLVDALPYMYRKEPDVNHIHWMIINLVFNVCCFITCCWSDPGVITKGNISLYKAMYQYDEILYKSDRKCVTCNLEKIARSKHCARLDKCVYKFDHYCLFTNSCIGGLNHRYFILFLLSICAMTCNGISIGIKSLKSIVDLKQLWNTRYLDINGYAHPMNLSVLIQTLFMQYPRLVFITTVLPIILTAVAIFTIYHLYLIGTNQTTNERYKMVKVKKTVENFDLKKYPFSKGLVSNVLELIFPLKKAEFVKENSDIAKMTHYKRRGQNSRKKTWT